MIGVVWCGRFVFTLIYCDELWSLNLQSRAAFWGHHIYENVWSPSLGEILPSERENGNERDPFAVAVLQSDTIVGHVPQMITSYLLAVSRVVSSAVLLEHDAIQLICLKEVWKCLAY